MKIVSEPIPYAEYLKRLDAINKATGESLAITPEAYKAYVEQIRKNQTLMVEAQKSYEEAKKIQEQLTKKLRYYQMISEVLSPKQRKMIMRIRAMTKR